MDVENGYFLVKFQSREVYEKVLTQRLWIVLGQYLTVQPWTLKFNPLQAFPNYTMVWVRFLGLLGLLYKRQILDEIEGLVGTIASLIYNKQAFKGEIFQDGSVYRSGKTSGLLDPS